MQSKLGELKCKIAMLTFVINTVNNDQERMCKNHESHFQITTVKELIHDGIENRYMNQTVVAPENRVFLQVPFHILTMMPNIYVA